MSKNVIAKVQDELHKELKKYCADIDKSMKEFVIQAIKEKLDKDKKD